VAEICRASGIYNCIVSFVRTIKSKTGQSISSEPLLVQLKQNRWLKFGALLLTLTVLSFGLAYIFQPILSPFETTLYKFAWLAYLSIFGIMLLGNITIIAPIPITTAIMITMATRWDPILIALFASIGGSLGELSGYYAGYIGKKKIVNGLVPEHTRTERWMNRYGPWAVLVLALQPILPFDIAGLAAGASRMPLWKFMAALWPGKFIKYAIICYSGIHLINFLQWNFRP